jgi:hypothetical protein
MALLNLLDGVIAESILFATVYLKIEEVVMEKNFFRMTVRLESCPTYNGNLIWSELSAQLF